MDYACSRIAVRDGEVSPAEEWRTWSVVGSVLRYLSVGKGAERDCCGREVETKDKGGGLNCLSGSQAVCTALQVAGGGIWGRTRQDTWEVRWGGKMANSHGCECSRPCPAQLAVVQVR